MELIISLLVLVLIVAVVLWLIDVCGLPANVAKVVKILVVVIALLYVLQRFLPVFSGPVLRS